jgi:hypothetical protein
MFTIVLQAAELLNRFPALRRTIKERMDADYTSDT